MFSPHAPRADGRRRCALSIGRIDRLVDGERIIGRPRVRAFSAFSQVASVVQVSVGSSEHVIAPVPMSVTHVGVQVENPSLPHVDRAAQRVTLPLHFFGRSPHDDSAFTVWATQKENAAHEEWPVKPPSQLLTHL